MVKKIGLRLNSSLIHVPIAFMILGALFFSPVFAGPETLGPSPIDTANSEQSLDRIPQTPEETEDEGTDAVLETTGEQISPLGSTDVVPAENVAAPRRAASGYDAFNAGYQNRWKATFSKKTGKLKMLYGSVSKRYANGPENVAKEFLHDSHVIFGLSRDLSDLKLQRVHKTPIKNHVRFQQTCKGVPVLGVFVLVHSNKDGEVTMVQNDYVPGLAVTNKDIVTAETAGVIARNDLRDFLGKGAILSDASMEKVIVSHEGKYHYVWKTSIPTPKPWGVWIYHVDAENGRILYKANEIRSLRNGLGKAYKDNASWHRGRIDTVPLKSMYTSAETLSWGYLWGLHASIYDDKGHDPHSATYKFMYAPSSQKGYFDATHAYYQMKTVWDWWDKSVLRKYGSSIDYFYNNNFSIPAMVNVEGLCNAFYSPDIVGHGFPGFAFGNEESCGVGSEDLVIDNDVLRHEYAHAMMDWSGFDAQFAGRVDSYGRAMGEGNSDWFAYLYSNNPLIGDVAWAWTSPGYLRNLDNTRMYPRDVDLPFLEMPEEHYTGEIWGGYLYDLSRVLGNKALPYVYQSFFYFSPNGGFASDSPDFFDAIQAQATAEYDLTGKNTLTAKAWGAMTSRGLNALLRPPYSHSYNYFSAGNPGSDSPSYFSWKFPPSKTVSTKGNLLISGDRHEYVIEVTGNSSLYLTASVTSSVGGLVNPAINLYSSSGALLASAGPVSSSRSQLNYSSLPSGNLYVIAVTGSATSSARGYYSLSISLK